MKRPDIISRIAYEADVSLQEAERIMKAIENALTDELKKGTEIQLVGFGKFLVRDIPGRTWNNPQLGINVKIPAKKRPSFKAGKSLIEAIR